MNPMYLSPAVLTSYDGEEPPAGVPAPLPSPTPAGFDFTGFTPEQQKKVNALLASDRRKHDAQKEALLAEAASKTSLSAEDRAALEQQLAEVRASHQSAEQRAAAEKKQLEERYKKELASEKKAREDWEARYKQGTVERALQDAAIQGEAFNTETMMAVLRPLTRLTEVTDEKTGKGTGKFKVMVDFPDNDPETGEPHVAQHTPESAVKRMKDIPKYSNLFKSGAVGGVGGNSGVPTGGGKIDLRKLTQQQYMEIRAKNPELLGLRPLKKR